MAAGMYRLKGAEIAKKGGTILKLHSNMVTASRGSNGYYLLSNVGAGGQSLVLAGDVHEISAFLWEHKGIKNVRGDDKNAGEGVTNDIYATGGGFTPLKKVYTAINPLFDGIVENLKAAASGVGLGAGTSIHSNPLSVADVLADGGTSLADHFSNIKTIFQGKSSGQKKQKSAFLHFTGYAWDDSYVKVGSGKLKFADSWKSLLAVLEKGL